MGDYHWAIGVVLAAIASVISNIGLNLQKLTHLKIENESEEVKKHYYKSKVWTLGLVMIILGSVADFAALGFGAQSIIAPLGSLTLVCNVFFAPCMLGETLTRRDIIATFAIITGATLAVIFASHKDTIYGLDQLFGFYEQPRFGLYAIFILVMIGCLWSAIQYMEALRREDAKSVHYLRLVKYHRFCYAALSGTVGAQSVLFAKCTAELVMNSFMGQGFLLSYYQTWMVLICMCSTIFLQIKWMNQGLARFDALYIVPVFQSFWILISVLAGLIFFGEYAEMNHTQCIMFPMGVGLTIVGVFYLSLRGVDEDDNASGVDRPVHTGKKKTVTSEAHRRKDASRAAETTDLYDPDHVEDAQDETEAESAALLAASTNGEHPHPGVRHVHHVRRIDSRVGFMGTGSPAGFLPSRAMTLANSLRPIDEANENEDEVGDDAL